MKRIPLLLPFLALGACCCPRTDAPAPDPEARVVVDLMHRAYADLSARNFEALAAYFLSGATFTMVGAGRDGSVRVDSTNLPDFVATVKKAVEGKSVYGESIVSADARVNGRVAQVWIRFAARIGNEGKVREWGGIDAWTLVKGPEGWKISSISVSQD